MSKVKNKTKKSINPQLEFEDDSNTFNSKEFVEQ